MKTLDKKAVWVFFASYLASSIIFSSVFVFWAISMSLDEGEFFNLEKFILWMLLVLILLSVIAFIWAKLSYHFYKYELTDLGFRKESGVIYKKYITIPYARIQNVDINRGIIARLLGLSDLHIQTAGASATMSRYGATGPGAEGRLPGLSRSDAEVLRDELIKRASGSKSQGL